MKEVWKKIEGWNDRYEISNKGRVRSMFTGSPHIMSHVNGGDGYHTVALSDRGRKKRFYIHRLVAYYFIGPPPKNKPFVLHKDDDKDNNELPNLYYGSPAMNTRDAFLNGRMKTILSDEEVAEIKSREGEDIGELSKEYDVTPGSIHNIFSGRSWSWVEPENKEVSI